MLILDGGRLDDIEWMMLTIREGGGWRTGVESWQLHFVKFDS